MASDDPVKKKGVDAVFQDRLSRVAQDTEVLLDRLLGSRPIDGELARPTRLLEAMRYASLGGGKRLRPFLVVESATLFHVSRPSSLLVGAAVECVHCYSLAHDDLPAMDNDDLRRGRPTTHKAFDEATAILAGDGLLTLAFDILSRPETRALPVRFWARRIKSSGRHSSATVRRWARRSRSRTIFSMWKAIQQRSAKQRARTRPPTRQHSSAYWDPPPRDGVWKAWSSTHRRRSITSAAMQTCSRPQRGSSPHAGLEERPRRCAIELEETGESSRNHIDAPVSDSQRSRDHVRSWPKLTQGRWKAIRVLTETSYAGLTGG